jgi:hypothetical protein
MSKQTRVPLAAPRSVHSQPDNPSPEPVNTVCPVCGGMVETRSIGSTTGWVCLAGGYAHYYQARYGHLKQWFTSGEGNLREPVIKAMNCAA